MSETLRVINVTIFKVIVRALSVISENRTAHLRFRFNPAGDDITTPAERWGEPGSAIFTHRSVSHPARGAAGCHLHGSTFLLAAIHSDGPVPAMEPEEKRLFWCGSD